MLSMQRADLLGCHMRMLGLQTQNEETSAALDRLADEVLQDTAGDPRARLESLAEVRPSLVAQPLNFDV